MGNKLKYEDIKKLTKEEISKLSEKEILEALEDYTQKEHDIIFDDSETQLDKKKK